MANVKDSNPKDAIGIRKPPFSVIPMNVMAEVGLGLMEGALKYGRHNYRGIGVRASVYFDATMRHLTKYWEGNDIDEDSGLHEVTKAICSLVVLRDALMQGKCEDDRPPASEPFYDRLYALAEHNVETYGDLNPKHWTIQD